MSKRGSGAQLTRFAHEQENGPTDSEPIAPQMASAEVMAGRKIAAPRGGSKFAPKANPFAGFKPQAGQEASKEPQDDTLARKVGLNKKFALTIAEYAQRDPAGDWSAACEKYLQYYKSLGASSGAAPFKATPAPAAAPAGPVQYKPPSSFTFGHAPKAPSQGKISFEPPKSFTFGGKSAGGAEAPAPKKEEPKKEEPKKEVAQPEAPKFSFNQSTENKPFQFGAKSQEEPKPFSFNAGGSNAAPFGAKADEEPKKPFSFNAGGNNAAPFGAPNLNFGGQIAAAPASFKFGDAAKPAERAPFGGSTNGAPKFTFGQPSTAKSFGEAANSSGFSLKPPTDSWQPSAKESIPEEDEEEANDEQQANLALKGAGEESEESIHEVKAKLYSATNEVVGLGQLRLLVHKDTKKARVVMRAEGSGRVLLNTSIQKAINYTSTKQFVTIPYFGGDKPTTFKARVKTEQDAADLAAKFNQVKA